uniref:Uncharacterized protein n=1 Tax=Piliocolobus tephrosceles TaxID=591936 RepID=A0A8C9G8G3_9PRIM
MECGVGGEQRGNPLWLSSAFSACRLLGSPGPWFDYLPWGMLVRPRDCQEVSCQEDP